MKNILVLVMLIFRITNLVECLDELATLTENSITIGQTCFDSSCIYEETDFTTDTQVTTELMEKTTVKAATSTAENRNTVDIQKKNSSTENQSESKTTKDKSQKPTTSEPTRKPITKPKPKPKEDKPKLKPDKPLEQNKTSNATNQTNLSMSNVKPFRHEKSCNCDTSSGICEINCCCDDDCSKEHKKAFTFCEDESNYISKSDYCFSPNVIYKNNTPYKAFNLRPGLLCIARDNLPDKIKYYTHQVIVSKSKLSKTLKQRKLYQWKLQMDDFNSELDISGLYNFGSPVWVLKNLSNQLSLEKLSILHEGVSSLCTDRYQIGYLENAYSTCLIKGSTKESVCMQTFKFGVEPFADIYVLKSPHRLNLSIDLQDTPFNEVFVKVKFILCKEKKCSNLSSFQHDNNRICSDFVRKVSCTIKHNGTDGIADMICVITTELAPLDKEMFRQHFEMKFDWINSDNKSFPRSGKPGYLRGKPLIVGNKTQKIEDGANEIVFYVSHNKEDWITVISFDRDGFCGNQRNNIVFNQNIKAECTLKIKNQDFNHVDNCSAIHEKTVNVLFGKTEKIEDLWISSWGDPKFEDKSSWVPLIKLNDDEIPQCDRIITSARYNFIYSLSGPIGSPQAKLIGATVETMSSPFTCDFTECFVQLVTSVTFSPVSTIPKLLYPKHPALRIHLPKDFFYPFSSSTARLLMFNSNLLIITLAIISKVVFYF